MILPIFPLTIYLLPEGVTQLRIFEQRYINMVKNSHKTDGFVIAYALSNEKISEWGSWVDIIDFATDSDGLLTIMVKCKKLVAINNTYYQDDNLMLGKVTTKPHWPAITANERCFELKQQFERLYESHPALQQLYGEPQFQRYDWVIARWLELLPVSFDSKSHFAHPNSFIKAVDFLTTIILEENDPN